MVAIATLRGTGDPLADAAVRELGQRGVSADRSWGELVALVRAQPSRFPATQRLVDQVQTVPSWLNRERLRAGQRLFTRHAVEASVVFTLDSLIQTYLVPEIADVLAHTGRLTREVERRLAETGKMVLDVITDGSMAPAGFGIASVLRVRLLHAQVRTRILEAFETHRPRSWPAGKVPIDQAELLLTLHAHDWVIVDGLRRLGVRARADEIDGYQHLWRYVGRLMGIDTAILPRSVEASRRSHARLTAALFAPNDSSRILTGALHDAASLQPPLFLPRPVIGQLTRYLLGDPMADRLGLPRRDTMLGALDQITRTRWAVTARTLPRFLPPRPRLGRERWAAPLPGELAPKIGRGYYDWMIRRSHRRAGIAYVPPTSSA